MKEKILEKLADVQLLKQLAPQDTYKDEMEKEKTRAFLLGYEKALETVLNLIENEPLNQIF